MCVLTPSGTLKKKKGKNRQQIRGRIIIISWRLGAYCTRARHLIALTVKIVIATTKEYDRELVPILCVCVLAALPCLFTMMMMMELTLISTATDWSFIRSAYYDRRSVGFFFQLLPRTGCTKCLVLWCQSQTKTHTHRAHFRLYLYYIIDSSVWMEKSETSKMYTTVQLEFLCGAAHAELEHGGTQRKGTDSSSNK